ncbi:hypothetical protein JX265_002630 [Neoarthrinium moseri]|uniref:Uncharacterized protein n=1 Tax=Neoarthrinium moseri TaxID=1658444 RepID=A0A9P9WUV4_9PEZI|nr:uncharacterized protein JN550_000442 [Neoarthrinium moseri]KAI1842833.1 hypothetical protein JX266_011009 [Neoarthrinium moseri]KAI1878260.1 hypothetical protein JN550_000442 [Neoarthrinium moseri]KAI1879676.1 hypothetical protein JX265_002630 [Neoarthrinium moseri]
MQIIKPLFALFCAHLAIASPITTNGHPSVELTERAPPPPSDALKKWNDEKGVPGNALTEGLHIFKAKYPRDEVKDQGLSDLIKEARNFLDANHYVLVSVEVKQKERGPPKKKEKYLDVGDVKFFDIAVDKDGKVKSNKEGATYNFAKAEEDKVEHQYLKKLGGKVKSFTGITPVGKEYVSQHETYDPKTNNCMTFVDEVAKDLN